MAKDFYLTANLNFSTDTFETWLTRTNQIVYDMGTVVVTTEANTTGATTSGNGHVEGILSANTLAAGSALRGGTVSAAANLVITSNSIFNSNTTINGAQSTMNATTFSVTSNTIFNAPRTDLFADVTNIGETANDTLSIAATTSVKATLFVDHTDPQMQLIDNDALAGDDKARFMLTANIAHLQGTANGKLRLSGFGSTDLTDFKARYQGAWYDILHEAIGVKKSGDTMTGSLKIDANNGSIELGKTDAINTPFIDFHSAGTNKDYDTRIIASGGDANTSGLGTLTFHAGITEFKISRMEIRPGKDEVNSLRLFGSSANTYASIGQSGVTSYLSAATSGSENAHLAFRTSNAGSEIDRLVVQSDGNVRPGADDAQNLGTTSKKWASVFATRLYADSGNIYSRNDAGNRHMWFTDLAGVEKAVVWHNNADDSFRIRHKDAVGTTINELKLAEANGLYLNSVKVVTQANGYFTNDVTIDTSTPTIYMKNGSVQGRIVVDDVGGNIQLRSPVSGQKGVLFLADDGTDLGALQVKNGGGVYRDILHTGNGVEAVNVKFHGATGDGVTDDTAAIDAAKTSAATKKVPLVIPAGSYLYSNTVYDVDELSYWMDSNFTGGVNPVKELSQKNILVTAETSSNTTLDNALARIGIGVTIAAKGAQHGSGVRSNLLNYSTDGQGCTAFYGRATNDTNANWGAAVHGETRHAGGVSIGLSAEAASYSNTGSFYGVVVNNTTNGAEDTHPITGGGKVEHPLATGIFVQGSNDVSTLGAWQRGIHFSSKSLRPNAFAIFTEAPSDTHFLVGSSAAANTADIYLLANSQNGIILGGTYGSGNAIRMLADQAIAFENTGAKKLRWNSTNSRYEFLESNLELNKVQPALWFKDGTSDGRIRLAGDSLIFERDKASTSDDFANVRVDREANYSGGPASSGNVSSALRVRTNVANTAGDANTTKPEWAINGVIENSSPEVHAVATSGVAKRYNTGPVWAGHFSARDETSPTSTSATRGIETNIEAVGADTALLRTVLDVAAHSLDHTYNLGADNIARGVRIVADSADFKRGLEIAEFSGTYTESAIYIETPANAIRVDAQSQAAVLDLGSLEKSTAGDTLSVYKAYGKDSANNKTTYAEINSVIDTPTDGGERGRWLFKLNLDGVMTTTFDLRGGSAVNPVFLMVNSALKQVTQGAVDSGGTGFRVLRVPN